MRTITVTTARKRFGALLKAVQHEPMLISRKNRDATVMMSAEEYARIRAITSIRSRRARPHRGDKVRRRKEPSSTGPKP
ncbi:MAG: type II toxin-antitoxin system Phd/YefM family antitoxin [Terriglobales bacterium]